MVLLYHVLGTDFYPLVREAIKIETKLRQITEPEEVLYRVFEPKKG